MRILHVSDLHFGSHDDVLKDNLAVRVQTLKPNVIVATGDLADQPEEALLISARDFLQGLAELCTPAQPDAPTLLAIPGNHDVKDLGTFGLWPNTFRTVFTDVATNFYWDQANIWIYGLDSCGKVRVGANGFVRKQDLARFDKAYQELKDKHKERFESAYKIVLIHHHPVPIQYDSRSQRWLTLVNAGEFLGEVLKHKVDLVLHGHEHVEARCRYGRALRHNSDERVQVIAVGAALKSGVADKNWFHLISFEESGEVRLDKFRAEGSTFDQDPTETVWIRSLPEAREARFDQWVAGAGYRYGEVASITVLDRDGDAHRIIECEDLEILRKDPAVDRASQHRVRMSTTAGYIDLPKARPLKGGPLGLKLTPGAGSTEKSVQAAIDYGVKLAPRQKISYLYEYWGVNAFAMNEREFRLKYDDPEAGPVEFTYYPVEDPIEDLLIVLRFPPNFPTVPELGVLAAKPTDVTRVSGWQQDTTLQESLRKSLRYVESLRIAALRVHRPEPGYHYGIQWRLPPSPAPAAGEKSGQIKDLLGELLALGGQPQPRRELVLLLLRSVADLVREDLLPDWEEPIEVSMAVLDEEHRKMVMVAAANVDAEDGATEAVDYSAIHFDYGEGIVGKVFKTNEYRLYLRVQPEERTAPDFYRDKGGCARHEVLLAMPVRNPDANEHVYAVIHFGSESAGCPLRNLESPKPEALEALRDLQEAINALCFDFLTGDAWKSAP